MENTYFDSGLENDLSLDDRSIEALKQTASWGKFLAIIGFISVGITVVLAFFIGSIFNNLPGVEESPFPFPTFLITIVYLFMAALSFFPSLYLFNFSKKMQSAIEQNDRVELTDSIINLKSLFKFIGITTIIVIALYAMVFLGAAVGGVLAG